MTYILLSILAVGTLWFIIADSKASFYTTIALIAATSLYLYMENSINIAMILIISLSYFCLLSYSKRSNSSKNTYKELLKYLPLAAIISLYFLPAGLEKLGSGTSSDRTTLLPSILISIISIMICFTGIITSLKRTRGNRDYD